MKAINPPSSPSLVFAWGGTVQVPEEYRDALCMMIHSSEAEFMGGFEEALICCQCGWLCCLLLSSSMDAWLGLAAACIE